MSMKKEMKEVEELAKELGFRKDDLDTAIQNKTSPEERFKAALNSIEGQYIIMHDLIQCYRSARQRKSTLDSIVMSLIDKFRVTRLKSEENERLEGRPKQDIIEFLCGAGTYDSLWWGQQPKDKRPTFWWRSHLRDEMEKYKQRVEELQKENEQKSSWLEAYKKSNAEFMKSLTDLKFEKERLEKENERLDRAYREAQTNYLGAVEEKLNALSRAINLEAENEELERENGLLREELNRMRKHDLNNIPPGSF